jgi:hypothetical protein
MFVEFEIDLLKLGSILFEESLQPTRGTLSRIYQIGEACDRQHFNWSPLNTIFW